ALVDPDSSDPVRDGLNNLVLRLATSLASREAGELHVGHAWSLEFEPTLRLSPFLKFPRAEVDTMVREAEATHREELDTLTARHHVNELGGSVHMLSGDPREVLPRLARRLGVGLIVMGTVARTGLSSVFMGNTAEDILRSVDCSVLAVKPEGFVTPVKLGRRRA
ncbi:MAG: universal stress protein, partial [Polyangiales bacterium]